MLDHHELRGGDATGSNVVHQILQGLEGPQKDFCRLRSQHTSRLLGQLEITGPKLPGDEPVQALNKTKTAKFTICPLEQEGQDLCDPDPVRRLEEIRKGTKLGVGTQGKFIDQAQRYLERWGKGEIWKGDLEGSTERAAPWLSSKFARIGG